MDEIIEISVHCCLVALVAFLIIGLVYACKTTPERDDDE